MPVRSCSINSVYKHILAEQSNCDCGSAIRISYLISKYEEVKKSILILFFLFLLKEETKCLVD